MAKPRPRSPFAFRSAAEVTRDGEERITAEELGTLIGVLPEKILALAAGQYLTVIEEKNPAEQTVLLKPRPAGLEWLRQALGPVPFCPMVQLIHAAAALDLSPGWFRHLALDHNITLYIDPALGEVLSVGSFYSLIDSLYPQHEKHRFDRQMFFSVLSGLCSGEVLDLSLPLGYDKRLEAELARVAKLPQIQRDIRSMNIVKAWKDAKSVAGVVRRIGGVERTPVADRVDAIMASWEARSNPFQSSSGSSPSSISLATSEAERSSVKPPSTGLVPRGKSAH